MTRFWAKLLGRHYHEWGKWEMIQVTMTDTPTHSRTWTEQRQTRQCKTCGKREMARL